MKRYNNLIGISIGNGEVSMFQDLGGHPVMEIRHIPAELMNEGRIADRQKMANLLGNMVRNGDFSGRDCAIVLPEYSTYFRSMTMQPMTEAELKLNLPYEFRDFVGDDSSKYFYDYALNDIVYEGEEPLEMDIFAGAVRKDEIEAQRSLYKEAGLNIRIALPLEMTIINLFRHAIKNGADAYREFCLVDIGYAQTRVYIVVNGKIAGSKVIYMGGGQVDKAIADALDINVNDAMKVRVENKNGILDQDYCREIFDDIAVEVMKAVNFYKFENPDSQVADIHFCGTDSDIFEIRNAILNALDFNECDIAEILPEDCRDLDNAYRGIRAIGAVMQEGRVTNG